MAGGGGGVISTAAPGMRQLQSAPLGQPCPTQMINPYTPPEAHVEDIAEPRSPGWLRVFLAVVAFSALALVLSWFVAPAASSVIMSGLGASPGTPNAAFLFVDLLLSFLAFVLSCSLAARMAWSHHVVAAFGVALIGWLVYFVVAGGPWAMLSSQYPLWYEFFPSHFGAAALAVYLAPRRRT